MNYVTKAMGLLSLLALLSAFAPSAIACENDGDGTTKVEVTAGAETGEAAKGDVKKDGSGKSCCEGCAESCTCEKGKPCSCSDECDCCCCEPGGCCESGACTGGCEEGTCQDGCCEGGTCVSSGPGQGQQQQGNCCCCQSKKKS